MLERTAAIQIKTKQKAWKVTSLLDIFGVKIQLSINIKTQMCQLLKKLPEPAKISESLKHFWLCIKKVFWKLLLHLNWTSSKVYRFILTKKILTVIKNKISFKKWLLKVHCSLQIPKPQLCTIQVPAGSAENVGLQLQFGPSLQFPVEHSPLLPSSLCTHKSAFALWPALNQRLLSLLAVLASEKD